MHQANQATEPISDDSLDPSNDLGRRFWWELAATTSEDRVMAQGPVSTCEGLGYDPDYELRTITGPDLLAKCLQIMPELVSLVPKHFSHDTYGWRVPNGQAERRAQAARWNEM
jgi:hypothetical protein